MPSTIASRLSRVPPAVRLSLVVLVLLVAWLGPRLHGIDRMLTTDETDWLGGAANVYTGVAHGDLAATYQLPHPGATTLWAGVLAFVIRLPDYPALYQGDVPFHRVDLVLRDLGVDPMSMLVTARVIKLLFEATLFVVAFVLMRRLFGPVIATCAALLISFEPFLIGQDRFLHIDGMVASASFAAALAVAVAAGPARGRGRWWALAGVLSALAWLTRFTAGVVGVVAVAAIVGPALVAVVRRRERPGAAWRRVWRPLAAYLGSSLVTTVTLLPALVVAPVATLRSFWDYVVNAAETGHELPIFYGGRIVSGDPGAMFYPDAILWRMTPVVLVALFVLVAGAIVWPRTFLPPATRWPLATVASFAVLYAGLMDAGAKKFDRYVLPVFPVLDLLAAVGLVGLARLLWEARHVRREVLTGVAVATLLVAQVGAAWSDRAYGLDYYNPLRGGIAAAQHDMQLGWGEGMDQAGAFILSQPGGDHATVRTQVNQVTLLYLMPPTVTVLNSSIRPGAEGIDQWATTDYYVSYVSSWVRDLNATMQDQADRSVPMETITVDGVAYAVVYDVRAMPPPPDLVAGLTCRWDLGDDATLLTYADRSTRGADGDANTRRIDIHVQAGAGYTADHEIRVRLVPRDPGAGLETIEATATLPPAAAPGALTTASVDVTLPHGRTTGSYDLQVTLIDPASGEGLPARANGSPILSQPYATANACRDAGVVD